MEDYHIVVPGDVEPEERSTFAMVASWLCVAAPFALAGIGAIVGALIKTQSIADKHLIFMATGLAAMAVMGGGFVAGVLALIWMKRGQRTGVIVRCTAGLGISLALVVAIAIPNFIRARKQAMERKEAMASVSDAVEDARDRAVAGLNKDGSTSVNVDAVQKSLGEAAKKTTGDEAAVYTGAQTYMKNFQGMQASYQTALKALSAGNVLATSNLTDKAELPKRRALVTGFLDANKQARTFVEQNEMNFKKELVKAGASPQAIESALIGFRKTGSPQKPLLLSIRDSDDSMGRAVLGALDLLDASWGHWDYNKTSQRVRFESTATLQRYNTFITTIQQATVDERDAQKQLASVMAQVQTR